MNIYLFHFFLKKYYLLIDKCQATMKSKDRWVNSKTSVYNLGYHIIWCPKYRRKILIGNIEKRCNELNCELETMEVMPDHVHLFLKSKPTLSPHFNIQQIKGYTSHILREEFPELKSKLPNMWTRSYYIESIGHISQKTIKQYIQDQKNK